MGQSDGMAQCGRPGDGRALLAWEAWESDGGRERVLGMVDGGDDIDARA